MAWGYWSATNIDRRGRSPRRNNNGTATMPMNPVPQSEPPAPQQCYSPCQRSPCTSACQSACQSPCQSPQHSVAGEQDPDTVSQQQQQQQQQPQQQQHPNNHNPHQTSAEIGYDQQSLLSYNPHQQQQHHSQYQQHIIPLEEYHRRQSVERLDSPQVRVNV